MWRIFALFSCPKQIALQIFPTHSDWHFQALSLLIRRFMCDIQTVLKRGDVSPNIFLKKNIKATLKLEPWYINIRGTWLGNQSLIYTFNFNGWRHFSILPTKMGNILEEGSLVVIMMDRKLHPNIGGNVAVSGSLVCSILYVLLVSVRVGVSGLLIHLILEVNFLEIW